MITGSETGELRVYADIESQKYGTFTLLENDYGHITDGGRIVPALTDIDDDGYYEMILGNKRGGLTAYNTDLQVSTTAVADTKGDLSGPSLVPNPTDGTVHLTGEFDGDGLYEISVYEPDGRHVLSTTIQPSVPMHLDLSPGIYVVTIRSKDHAVTQKLLMR